MKFSIIFEFSLSDSIFLFCLKESKDSTFIADYQYFTCSPISILLSLVANIYFILLNLFSLLPIPYSHDLRKIISAVISAGLTPLTRDACPRFSGFSLESFSRASFDSDCMFA